MTGSAATIINRKLRKLGGTSVAAPISFLVHENNLLDGEVARAVQWGVQLASAATSSYVNA
jgi:hypothetical protein